LEYPIEILIMLLKFLTVGSAIISLAFGSGAIAAPLPVSKAPCLQYQPEVFPEYSEESFCQESDGRRSLVLLHPNGRIEGLMSGQWTEEGFSIFYGNRTGIVSNFRYDFSGNLIYARDFGSIPATQMSVNEALATRSLWLGFTSL
jgi:hypothetical protein